MPHKPSRKFLLASYALIIFVGIGGALISNNNNFDKKMATKGKFACALECMDGRGQHPTEDFVRQNSDAEFVDVITEPGINKILAENTNKPIVSNIKKRLEISVHHHGTEVVAISAHEKCAGNPVDKDRQIEDLRKAKGTVESFGLNVEVILLWVPEGWKKAELVK